MKTQLRKQSLPLNQLEFQHLKLEQASYSDKSIECRALKQSILVPIDRNR